MILAIYTLPIKEMLLRYILYYQALIREIFSLLITINYKLIHLLPDELH